MRKYLTLIEPDALDKWLISRCQLHDTDRQKFVELSKKDLEKYRSILNVVAMHSSNEQQFLGACGMVIAILECLEEQSRNTVVC